MEACETEGRENLPLEGLTRGLAHLPPSAICYQNEIFPKGALLLNHGEIQKSQGEILWPVSHRG